MKQENSTSSEDASVTAPVMATTTSDLNDHHSSESEHKDPSSAAAATAESAIPETGPSEHHHPSESEHDDSGDFSDSDTSPASLASTLRVCPRCNHSYCRRSEWISHYAPTLTCDRTITPAGNRYCCRCGNFYSTTHSLSVPADMVSDRGIRMGAPDSPTTASQLGLPPPPPPPPPVSDADSETPVKALMVIP